MANVTKMNEIGVNANRTYKDSVFTLLFSEKKERLISLYNAVSGSNYPNDAEIKMNTLEGTLVLNKLNDISFEIDGKIVVLIEYQSLSEKSDKICYPSKYAILIKSRKSGKMAG